MQRLFILGDSYSTFEGYNPEGYAVYYSKEQHPACGVFCVEDTWWHRVISELGATLVENNSWSGSTVCHMGYNGSDCSKTSSFIFRMEKLIGEGFFKKNPVDTLLVFGGTNDSWANVPLGEMKLEGATEQELFSFLPAVAHLASLLTSSLPDTRIVFVANTEIKQEIIDGIALACRHFGAECITLHDVDKVDGHPTKQGMKDISEQVTAYLTAAR